MNKDERQSHKQRHGAQTTDDLISPQLALDNRVRSHWMGYNGYPKSIFN